MPLVTIVTPVYNGAPWFERTMASVQRQTYANIVYAVLDNASTDDTPDVIARSQNLKVPLITQRNDTVLSQSDNWNAAIKLVPPQTKYILFLCGDDLIRADAVEKFVAMAETDPEISVVLAGDVVDGRVYYPRPPEGQIVARGWDYIRSACRRDYNHIAWQCFFARWQAEDAKSDYFSHESSSLDVERVLRLMERGWVGLVREPLIYSRQHDGTVTSQTIRNHDPKLRFTHWEIAMRYAHRVFARREMRLWRRRAKYFVLRFQLYYIAIGARDSARKVARRFREDGYPIKALEFVRALLDYLPHKKRKQRATQAAYVPGPQIFTEAEFTGYRTPESH